MIAPNPVLFQMSVKIIIGRKNAAVVKKAIGAWPLPVSHTLTMPAPGARKAKVRPYTIIHDRK